MLSCITYSGFCFYSVIFVSNVQKTNRPYGAYQEMFVWYSAFLIISGIKHRRTSQSVCHWSIFSQYWVELDRTKVCVCVSSSKRYYKEWTYLCFLIVRISGMMFCSVVGILLLLKMMKSEDILTWSQIASVGPQTETVQFMLLQPYPPKSPF